MNRFAVGGLLLSSFAWVTILSVMSGMQGQIKERVLAQKSHILWEGRPQSGAQELFKQVNAELGENLESVDISPVSYTHLTLPTNREV